MRRGWGWENLKDNLPPCTGYVGIPVKILQPFSKMQLHYLKQGDPF